MIPLPRAWLLAGALLVGTAVGMLLAFVFAVLIDVHVRPDVAIALVVGIPGVCALVLILSSTKRWLTTVGAFLLAVGPGWLGVLVGIQAVHGV